MNDYYFTITSKDDALVVTAKTLVVAWAIAGCKFHDLLCVDRVPSEATKIYYLFYSSYINNYYLHQWTYSSPSDMSGVYRGLYQSYNIDEKYISG